MMFSSLYILIKYRTQVVLTINSLQINLILPLSDLNINKGGNTPIPIDL